MIAEGGIGYGGLRKGKTRFMSAGYGGCGERTKSNTPAFEEYYLDRSLVLRRVVYGAKGGGAVAEPGVEGFVVEGDARRLRWRLEKGGEEVAG